MMQCRKLRSSPCLWRPLLFWQHCGPLYSDSMILAGLVGVAILVARASLNGKRQTTSLLRVCDDGIGWLYYDCCTGFAAVIEATNQVLLWLRLQYNGLAQ